MSKECYVYYRTTSREIRDKYRMEDGSIQIAPTDETIPGGVKIGKVVIREDHLFRMPATQFLSLAEEV